MNFELQSNYGFALTTTSLSPPSLFLAVTAFAAGAATGRPHAEPQPKPPLPPPVLPPHRHPWHLLRSPRAPVGPPRDTPSNAVASPSSLSTLVPHMSPSLASRHRSSLPYPISSELRYRFFPSSLPPCAHGRSPLPWPPYITASRRRPSGLPPVNPTPREFPLDLQQLLDPVSTAPRCQNTARRAMGAAAP